MTSSRFPSLRTGPLSVLVVSDPPTNSTGKTAVAASPQAATQITHLTALQVVWFKRDLRTQDHAPLANAIQAATKAATLGVESGAVLCIYIHEPRVAATPEISRQHSAFLRECLDDLRAQLNDLGGDILEVVGTPVEVFERLRVQLSGSVLTLWAHQETTGDQDFARDRAVKRWSVQHGVAYNESAQNGVVRGGARDNQVPHGRVFEEHIEAACNRLISVAHKDCVCKVIAADGYRQAGTVWAPLPWATAELSSTPMGAGVDKPGRIRGGRSVAMARLALFTQFERLAAYPKFISTPIEAADACSRLSPHLSFGTISDREVIRATYSAAKLAEKKLPKGRAEWIQRASAFFAQRLYWRSGYLQMLESRAELEWGGDVEALMGLREPHFSAERFDRWATGHTGFPMIDASMRMLHEIGWINMRMRGMLASFALNELWLPPREVGLHLARLFLDLEPAIHWGQIAIHAGLLSSSRPLVYNSIKQAQDQDPDGEFVRRWVPELVKVPAAQIIEPWRMSVADQEQAGCRIGVDYPAPIVDLKAASKCAKDRVYALREGRTDPGGLPFECVLHEDDHEAQDAKVKKPLKAGRQAPLASPAVASQMALF